jgi:hypothetical protein
VTSTFTEAEKEVLLAAKKIRALPGDYLGTSAGFFDTA